MCDYLSVCVVPGMCLSFSEGSEELQSRSKLLRLLDAVTDALVLAIAKTGLTFRQQYTRLAHLLMLLSHIRHARYQRMRWCSPCYYTHAHTLSLRSHVLLTLSTVTRAWTISTAWRWRTWCLCTTCCWRCWTPTSCTAPVSPVRPPSRSPRTRRRFPLGIAAQEADPPAPGLPAAQEVNPSSQQIFFYFFCFFSTCNELFPLRCTKTTSDR